MTGVGVGESAGQVVQFAGLSAMQSFGARICARSGLAGGVDHGEGPEGCQSNWTAAMGQQVGGAVKLAQEI
ncbi:hypothetical protein FRC12_010621 [Ceratobasidium sp. 428]|nr:hypothetical protein FRC12_010621 [Ceratobasidium sp. 428]